MHILHIHVVFLSLICILNSCQSTWDFYTFNTVFVLMATWHEQTVIFVLYHEYMHCCSSRIVRKYKLFNFSNVNCGSIKYTDQRGVATNSGFSYFSCELNNVYIYSHSSYYDQTNSINSVLKFLTTWYACCFYEHMDQDKQSWWTTQK